MIVALAVALGGGLGAVLRYVTDLAVSSKLGRTVPWGTMFINVAGSAGAGLVLGLTTYQQVSPKVATVVLIGFLGGFTTASTLAYEAARLTQSRRVGAAAAVITGTMVASLAAGIAGLAIGGGLT